MAILTRASPSVRVRTRPRRPATLQWLRALLGGAILIAIVLREASGGASEYPEYQVKAGLLFNLAKFVEWRAKAFPLRDSPIVFGVLGEDPFAGALARTLEGKSISGRRLVLRNFQKPEEVESCHLLWVSDSEEGRLRAILPGFAAKGIFTVGEGEEFTRQGGGLRFFLEEKKIRFEINLWSTERAELKVSSKLLSLARVVRLDPEGGK